MENRPVRIIIDTNLWISFLISKDYTKLDRIILYGACVLIFSEELLKEFLSVTQRPKFKRFFSAEDTENLMNAIKPYARIIEVKSNVRVCRDGKDNFLLSLSKDSGADFLVTGDYDLLDLKKFEHTQILTISEFLNKIE